MEGAGRARQEASGSGLSPALSSILLLLPCSEQTLSTLPLAPSDTHGFHFLNAVIIISWEARLGEVGLLFRRTAHLEGSTVNLGEKENAGNHPKGIEDGILSPLLLARHHGGQKISSGLEHE